MSRAIPIVEWTDDGTGRVPVFFDGLRRLVCPLHDYVESVAASRRDSASAVGYRSSVDAATYALLGWLKHLDTEGKGLWDVNDALLTDHRDALLAAVMRSPRGKKDRRLGQRTVNTHLRWIYRFYAWAQEEVGLCAGLVGRRGPLTSALCEPGADAPKGKRRSDNAEAFPKCFKRVSGRSGGKQHFATSDEKKKLLNALASSEDSFVRERNRLWVELTDRVGWRAGTLTGLEVEDFSAARMTESGDGRYLVTPKVQKFGYGGAFEVPATLTVRVLRFIAVRQEWLRKRGWTEAATQGRLFLSATTGGPLGPKTIVQAFGRAYREIGVPAGRGAGHHSLRRKFGDEVTKQELEARREMGLSTAAEDLMHVTARRLGQRSIASQGPYQRAVRSGTRQADAYKLREALQEKDDQIAEKDEMILRLEQQLSAAAVSAKSRRRVRKSC